jgi:hypothetical protein
MWQEVAAFNPVYASCANRPAESGYDVQNPPPRDELGRGGGPGRWGWDFFVA